MATETPLQGKALDEYLAWKERARKRIRALIPRVLTLAEQFYEGCGFHYGMENNAGKIWARLNNYSKIPTLSESLLDEVFLEDLCNSVVKAEKSALKIRMIATNANN